MAPLEQVPLELPLVEVFGVGDVDPVRSVFVYHPEVSRERSLVVGIELERYLLAVRRPSRVLRKRGQDGIAGEVLYPYNGLQLA